MNGIIEYRLELKKDQQIAVWILSVMTQVSLYQKKHLPTLELVDKFCHLGDMLSVDRDADAAVETRIWIGWNKFRQLVRGTLYSSSVLSSMLCGIKPDP